MKTKTLEKGRVYSLESVIEAVRSLRALRFVLCCGSLGSRSITEQSLLFLALLLRPQILKIAKMHEIIVIKFFTMDKGFSDLGKKL